ncbi:hypothetical protein W97_02000 [Coniosporium apollinis CBS 100218]|uniref:Fungal N-terminal domain-containing protein n=1 Tax=Coniosporium apollinis (strain CBS 100218) TaxID=1168221 RepID=R7YLI9_CONA1|nr:uncharacterized protein W97_02000 [Coniosporium apollinis CBS 100218]EON62775.1 hypothetical protein W97_02000 [Coniosporium apollinis CBS 100218]
MVTPAFGFSDGDFIAAINLIVRVSKALNDSGGAASEYRMLLQELQQLQLILKQLREMSSASSRSHSHFNAVKGMALAIQFPLLEFLAKLERFNSSMCGTSSSSRWRSAPGKAQWAVVMQEEVNRMRAVITMKLVTITVLLALPTTEMLSRVKRAANEGQILLKETKEAVEDSNNELLAQIDAIRTGGCSRLQSINLDTSRLLQVCAGLRVSFQRLEKEHLTTKNSQQKQHHLVRHTLKQQSALFQTATHTLQFSLQRTSLAVGQLLKMFINFSKEVLDYLKRLQ